MKGTDMDVDLKVLAETIAISTATPLKTPRANTEDTQRDAYWRRIGKMVRDDVKHTR